MLDTGARRAVAGLAASLVTDSVLRHARSRHTLTSNVLQLGLTMTLTVRLDTTLEAALAHYCTERGVTRSLVVQESLAAYLLAGHRAPGAMLAGATGAAASANHRAFADAGLIGALATGGGSADKQAVRAQVMARLGERVANRAVERPVERPIVRPVVRRNVRPSKGSSGPSKR